MSCMYLQHLILADHGDATAQAQRAPGKGALGRIGHRNVARRAATYHRQSHHSVPLCLHNSVSHLNHLHPSMVRRNLHWSRTYAGERGWLLGRHQQAGLLQFLDVGRTPHALAEQGLGEQDLFVFACGFLLVRLLSFLQDMVGAATIAINTKTNSVANYELNRHAP